jgi:SAM-dependent methyltransferase
MPGAAQHFPDAASLERDTGCDLSLHECPDCGLLQLPGEPVPYYREVIRAAAFSSDMRAFRVKQLQQWIDQYELGGKRVLEVGCGRGEYLTLLAGCGVSAVGLEDGAGAVAQCRQAGLEAFPGFPDANLPRLPGAPFDGFMTLNFMEHWPAPIETLRAIQGQLAPGAIGLVEVPNLDMVLQEGLFSEFIRDHLSYFTRQTFSAALVRAGFEVLSLDSVWHDYILSAVVRKRVPTDLSALHAQQARITRNLHDFIAQFAPRSVAVWGAGHQALAVMALAGLKPYLRYVVDSAPFKQGKFTPATHLPIVAPTHLIHDPVEAVIVMAAAYSDEVARTIRERHGANMAVAILRPHGLETA